MTDIKRVREITKRLEELGLPFEVLHDLRQWTNQKEKEQTGEIKEECNAENPCCDRRNEYNGFASGPLSFVCPKHCSCHD